MSSVSEKARLKAEKMQQYLDKHMSGAFGGHLEEKKTRRDELENMMKNMNLDAKTRKHIQVPGYSSTHLRIRSQTDVTYHSLRLAALQAKLAKEEDEYAKKRRRKMNVDDFDTLTIIGRGAFGEVCMDRSCSEAFQ